MNGLMLTQIGFSLFLPAPNPQCTVTHVFYNDDCEFQIEECTTKKATVRPTNNISSRGPGSPNRVHSNVYSFRADSGKGWIVSVGVVGVGGADVGLHLLAYPLQLTPSPTGFCPSTK